MKILGERNPCNNNNEQEQRTEKSANTCAFWLDILSVLLKSAKIYRKSHPWDLWYEYQAISTAIADDGCLYLSLCAGAHTLSWDSIADSYCFLFLWNYKRKLHLLNSFFIFGKSAAICPFVCKRNTIEKFDGWLINSKSVLDLLLKVGIVLVLLFAL